MFATLLAHIMRRYPEVYGLGLDTARVPERRETLFGAGEGMSGGNSVTSSLNLGAYAGRLDNLNLAGINNPIPNLTTVYLDTPLVGPTPEPLEYVPLPGSLGQPSGYHPSSTRTSVSGARLRPPTPSPPNNTHPRMLTSSGRAQPRRGLQAKGPEKIAKFSAPLGVPLAKILSKGLERPNPPTHAYEHRGGVSPLQTRGPKFCKGFPLCGQNIGF